MPKLSHVCSLCKKSVKDSHEMLAHLHAEHLPMPNFKNNDSAMRRCFCGLYIFGSYDLGLHLTDFNSFSSPEDRCQDDAWEEIFLQHLAIQAMGSGK